MLADELDFVVGVDPHRDLHAIGVVEVRSGVVVFESSVTADSSGYAQALRIAERHAPGRRAFAVEGTGSYGAGLARFLADHGEQVFEVGRLRRERRSGGKWAGLCQLRDLLITTPEPLRSELRPLSRARLLSRLSATRPHRRRDPELQGTLLALRAVARRVQQLTAEERELAREIEQLTIKLAPQLLNQPGIGPLLAAQIVLSWSHRGRLVSEAAFARLAGAAPIPASSGQTIRHRLDRSGDRQLNRALHQIVVTRRRTHRPTIDYIERRVREGKSRREATRCLKRYLARNLYRLLEHPPLTT
jgi:transposase